MFAKSGWIWSEVQKLMASDGAINDLYGTSVDIYGQTLVVGALGHNSKGNRRL